MIRAFSIAVISISLVGCAASRDGTSATGKEFDSASRLVDVFDHIRIDADARIVEFDGAVSVDVHNAETPDVYLELIVTGPDSREYESLVVTRARPSEIHAALLLVGGQPGSPGSWRVVEGDVARVPPEGSLVRVEFITDGVARSPAAWIRREDNAAVQLEGFVFAGSRFVTHQGAEYYDADGTGTVVGLATFGSEVVGAVRVLSHESKIDAPVFMANNDAVPRIGTPVRVRLTVLDE